MSRFKWLEFDTPEPPVSGESNPHSSELDAGPDLTDPAVTLKMADEAYRQLRYERALKLYSRALGIDPNIEDAWVGQLLCLLDLRENPEAQTWATKAQKMFPDNASVISARALALARQGRMTDAMAFSDGAMKKPSTAWFPWLARGEILSMANSDTAKFCMTKALEMSRGDWLVDLKIALVFAASIRYQAQAAPIFLRVLGKHPDIAQAWFEFGLLYKDLGLYAKAAEAFERASAIEPNNKDYSTKCAEMLRIGPIDRLIGWLRNLVKGK